MISDPSAIGLLILHAKHDSDEKNRLFAGEELIQICHDTRNIDTLKEMIRTGEYHSWTRELAKKKITETALAICAEESSLRVLWKMVPDHTISYPVQQLSGMKLFEKLAQSGDLEGLLTLASNPDCHEEPRKASGFRLLHHHEEAKAYSSLYSLTVGENLLYEVRKTSGIRLSDLCVAEGNYPLLLRMCQDTRVPLNVRMDICDKPEMAALKAISQATAKSDTSLLSFISIDDRLPENVRKEAKSRLNALGKAEHGPNGHHHALDPPRRQSAPPPPSIPPSIRLRKITP